MSGRGALRRIRDDAAGQLLHRTGVRFRRRRSRLGDQVLAVLQQRIDGRFADLEDPAGEGLFLVEFLGEPINYPSNVKGGKGFFNLYIPDFRIFVLE